MIPAVLMAFSFHNLLLAFIPLFVAIDVPGGIPIFISLTEKMQPREKKKLIIEATITAGIVALVFLILGKIIFSFLGITEDDFRIAGGIVLIILAVNDLLFATETRQDPGTSIGVVPLGIPLIMGPAALTSLIIIVDSYGLGLSIMSLILNLLIVWLVFRYADVIIRILGESGSRGFAKVASLFMAAIAVMMIRVGIQNILSK